jgi:hypothetical protein
MTLPPSYDRWLEPDDPCCDLDGCDGSCQEDAEDAHEAAILACGEEQADYERGLAEDARVRRG